MDEKSIICKRDVLLDLLAIDLYINMSESKFFFNGKNIHVSVRNCINNNIILSILQLKKNNSRFLNDLLVSYGTIPYLKSILINNKIKFSKNTTDIDFLLYFFCKKSTKQIKLVIFEDYNMFIHNCIFFNCISLNKISSEYSRDNINLHELVNFYNKNYNMYFSNQKYNLTQFIKEHGIVLDTDTINNIVLSTESSVVFNFLYKYNKVYVSITQENINKCFNLNIDSNINKECSFKKNFKFLYQTSMSDFYVRFRHTFVRTYLIYILFYFKNLGIISLKSVSISNSRALSGDIDDYIDFSLKFKYFIKIKLKKNLLFLELKEYTYVFIRGKERLFYTNTNKLKNIEVKKDVYLKNNSNFKPLNLYEV